MLVDFPNDAFLRYGLAMEYVSAGDDGGAVRCFRRTSSGRTPTMYRPTCRLGKRLAGSVGLKRPATFSGAWLAAQKDQTIWPRRVSGRTDSAAFLPISVTDPSGVVRDAIPLGGFSFGAFLVGCLCSARGRC